MPVQDYENTSLIFHVAFCVHKLKDALFISRRVRLVGALNQRRVKKTGAIRCRIVALPGQHPWRPLIVRGTGISIFNPERGAKEDAAGPECAPCVVQVTRTARPHLQSRG